MFILTALTKLSYSQERFLANLGFKIPTNTIKLTGVFFLQKKSKKYVLKIKSKRSC